MRWIHAIDPGITFDTVREVRDMKCRMCSQRLTRPGKLCRECERELERARRAEFAIGELADVVMRSEDDAGAESAWSTKLRAPRNVIALAFCVGIAGGVGFVQHDSSRTTRSVMLDVAPVPSAARRQAPAPDAIALRGERNATTSR